MYSKDAETANWRLANCSLSMLRDLELFKTKLGHIDGFGDTCDYLTDIVKSKHVKSASPPPSETKGKDEKEEEATDKGDEANGGVEQ